MYLLPLGSWMLAMLRPRQELAILRCKAWAEGAHRCGRLRTREGVGAADPYRAEHFLVPALRADLVFGFVEEIFDGFEGGVAIRCPLSRAWRDSSPTGGADSVAVMQI